MSQVEVIKRQLKSHVGKRVIVKANKGRKKIVTRKGILEAVYPSLFVVKIKNKFEDERNASYTYSDVLTHNVVITIVDDDVDLELKTKIS